MAQWIGRRISDQGVPGSIPRRCTFRCGLEQVTFTLCLVLVKPRKRWTDDRLGQTVTILSRRLILLLHEKFIHLTQIYVCKSMQFLVLFGGLGEKEDR